ncbi:TetR family transcriptional regulator [Paenibacillus sp. BIHB 4019]|uniref:TetR family transcriptional regulator n=2 Tax=Paenibacillus sp. BIHB 4019 TaxID=1870819 RepID=A0A1B2DQR8_9BACL|nr:TetR family transcriptional regulator [Paenibacillus sp. BIHB 4019]
MPKIVDHNKRKEKIAEAVWRIIMREGLDSVSVRRVADEMAMSLGAIRHYFVSQDELLVFSMQLVSQRVNERIQALPFTGMVRHDMELIIWELMPLEEVSMQEALIWLAFAGRASVSEAIRAISLSTYEEIYNGLRRSLEHLIQQGVTIANIDAEYETARLHALVDGLVVHGVTYPQRFSKEMMKSIVSRHLDTLMKIP